MITVIVTRVIYINELTDDMSIKQRYRLTDRFQSLMDKQITHESSSSVTNVVVLFCKKDNSLLVYIDYRALSGRTKKGAFPIPRVDRYPLYKEERSFFHPLI